MQIWFTLEDTAVKAMLNQIDLIQFYHLYNNYNISIIPVYLQNMTAIDTSVKWEAVERMIADQFGKTPNMEAILFLIGIQELGKGYIKFSKEQKQDLMHIAVCTLLAESGYYKLDHTDEDGWPHFTELKRMQGMPLEQQEDFLKQHIIRYFEKRGLLLNADNNTAKH